MKMETGFYWIESPLGTGTPIIAYYTQERDDWTVPGVAARHVAGIKVISGKLWFIPKHNPVSSWTSYLTADELMQGLQTLNPEDRKKPLRIELSFSGNRVLPFNAHDAWCEGEDDTVVLKVQ